jgi:hypothetical protein
LGLCVAARPSFATSRRFCRDTATEHSGGWRTLPHTQTNVVEFPGAATLRFLKGAGLDVASIGPLRHCSPQLYVLCKISFVYTNAIQLPVFSSSYPYPYFYEYKSISNSVSVSRGTFHAPSRTRKTCARKYRRLRNRSCCQQAAPGRSLLLCATMSPRGSRQAARNSLPRRHPEFLIDNGSRD